MKIYGVEPQFCSDANKTLSLRAQNLKEINRFESSLKLTYLENCSNSILILFILLYFTLI